MYSEFKYLGDVIFWWMLLLPIFGAIEAILGIGWKKWLLLILNLASLIVILTKQTRGRFLRNLVIQKERVSLFLFTNLYTIEFA